MPSCDEYWHIGETTTRFSSAMLRRRNGWNIGASGFSTYRPAKPSARVSRATTWSACLTNSGARSARLS